MGIMDIFSKKGSKKSYCLFCGSELSDGKCTACGREAKETVPLSSLNWQQVPTGVASALGEQKKRLLGNLLYTAQEMIKNGDLFIADIHIDAAYETETDHWDDDDCRTEHSYFIQFSTPDLVPCDTDCAATADQFFAAEDLLKNGKHEGKILWGRKKKTNRYFAFVPQSSDITAMLEKELLEDFILYGELTTERRPAPKGGR